MMPQGNTLDRMSCTEGKTCIAPFVPAGFLITMARDAGFHSTPPWDAGPYMHRVVHKAIHICYTAVTIGAVGPSEQPMPPYALVHLRWRPALTLEEKDSP